MKHFFPFFLFILVAFSFFACTKEVGVGDEFTLKQNQKVTLHLDDAEIQIKIIEIRDGRCPPKAQCFVPDNVSVKVDITGMGVVAMGYLASSDPSEVNVYGKTLSIVDIDFGHGNNYGKTNRFKVKFRLD